MNNILKSLPRLSAIAFLFLCAMAGAYAAPQPAGVVLISSGPLIAVSVDHSQRDLKRRSKFFSGDTLRTGATTRAQIRFRDGAVVSLHPDTEFRVDEFSFDSENRDLDKSFSTLVKGGFRTISGAVGKEKAEDYQVRTPVATIGIRGTTYEVVIGAEVYVAVWDGAITVSNEVGALDLGYGAEFDFARIPSVEARPKGMLKPPPVFQENLRIAQALPSHPSSSKQDSDAGNAAVQNAEELEKTPRRVRNRGGRRLPPALRENGLSMDTGSDPVATTEAPRDGLAGAGPISTESEDGFNDLGQFAALGGSDSADGAMDGVMGESNDIEGVLTLDEYAVEDMAEAFTLNDQLTPVRLGRVIYGGVQSFAGESDSGVLARMHGFADVDFDRGLVTGKFNMVTAGSAVWNVDYAGILDAEELDIGTVSGTVDETIPIGGEIDGRLLGASAEGLYAEFSLHDRLDLDRYADGALLLNDTPDQRLLDLTASGLDRYGLAVRGGSSGELLRGRAGLTSSGEWLLAKDLVDATNPSFKLAPAEYVLRKAPSGTGILTDRSPDLAVDWGIWNRGIKQHSHSDPSVTEVIEDPIYWVAMEAAPSTAIEARRDLQARVTYDQNMQIYGGGTGGAIMTNSTASAFIDFATGQVNVDTEIRTKAGELWQMGYSGLLAGPRLDVQVVNGVYMNNGVNAVTEGAGGKIDALLVGPDANAVSGGFDFVNDSGNARVGGVFITECGTGC